MITVKVDSKMANDIIRDLTHQIFNSDSQKESLGVKNIADFNEETLEKVNQSGVPEYQQPVNFLRL